MFKHDHTHFNLHFLVLAPFPSVPLIFFAPAAFFPGLFVIVPSAFSSAPSTLSLRCGCLLWLVFGARFLVTPAPVVLFLVVVGLLVAVVEVAVALRLRSGVVETAAAMRGLELPVEARVEAICVVRSEVEASLGDLVVAVKEC